MKQKLDVLIFLDIAPAERFVVEEKLLKLPQIIRMFEVLGEYEVVIEVQVNTQIELGELINTLASTEGIRGIKTFVITKFIKP